MWRSGEEWQPRAPFTRPEAEAACQRVLDLTGAHYWCYQCPVCEEWHIIGERKSTRRRREAGLVG
jgi:hypothetical protein